MFYVIPGFAFEEGSLRLKINQYRGKDMSKQSKPCKSWPEKLADNKGLPKVEKITDKMSKRWGTGMVIIPAPKEVAEIMKKFPKVNLLQ